MVIKVNKSLLETLSLFTYGYNKEYNIREAAGKTGASSRTAMINLEKLERKGILKSKRVGKAKLYSINKNIHSREYFALAEQYKKILFLEKHLIMKEILEKLDGTLTGTTIIFGSYAKGTQKKDSDIDILTTSTYDKGKVLETEKKYGIEINIKKYPGNLLEKNMSKDPLLKEIKEYHIIIKDIEGFVRKAAEWTS